MAPRFTDRSNFFASNSRSSVRTGRRDADQQCHWSAWTARRSADEMAE